MGKGSHWFPLAMAALLAAPILGQEPSPDPTAPPPGSTGSELYRTYCATCHGVSAKGDGQLAGHLRFRPPDLTQLARHQKGKWDAEQVARIVDGRKPVKGHGGPDMPVWGDAFKSSREGYSEESVKRMVRAVVDHLESLQVPADKPSAEP